MHLFDLHCDTLYRAVTENESITDNDFHLSVKRGKAYKPWVQCMAMWVPDELRGEAAYNHVVKGCNTLNKQIDSLNDESVLIIRSSEQLSKVYKQNKSGIIFTVEGGAGLGGRVENVKKFSDMGVKILTLTWNKENEIGTGCLSDEKYGITKLGRQILCELEKYNIIADVSHASERLFYDVAQYSTRPFIATHSNSKTVCNHIRNLTDEQFLLIKEKGGIVGLNFSRGFLSENEKADIDDIVRHAEYFLSLGGENTVALGSDFDGTDMPNGINGIENMQDLYNRFLQLNYKEELLYKLFFNNAYNFCQNFDN